MKWRVILTVLFVLTIFAGFAYLYVDTFVRKHQHAVILFVVNGLDLNLLNMARQQIGRAPLHEEESDPAVQEARRRASSRSDVLNLDAFWNLALLGIQDPGKPVPDEGANATALACGQRVDNGFVAVNSRNEALFSLIYAAQRQHRATGLVTTSSLVQPTPVAFYSTIKGTPEPYHNASDLVYSGINVILGGGGDYFEPANVFKELGRRDGRNLVEEMKGRGYAIVHSRDELSHVSSLRTRQLFGLFAGGPFYFSSLLPEKARQPSLAEMTRAAVSSLNYNIGGYFLVVEDGLVGQAARQNLTQLAVNETAEVDEAIESAIEYAGSDALVVVTNSYSLGAIGLLAIPPADDLAASPPTVDADGSAMKVMTNQAPAVPAWLTGPGGPQVTRAQAAWMRQSRPAPSEQTSASLLVSQAAFQFRTEAVPTAEPAWLASRGEGSSELRGFFNNTDLFDILSEQF